MSTARVLLRFIAGSAFVGAWLGIMMTLFLISIFNLVIDHVKSKT